MKGHKKDGLVKSVRVHLQSMGLPFDFVHIHCIVHQEALCASSLTFESVMNVIVKVVNKNKSGWSLSQTVACFPGGHRQ